MAAQPNAAEPKRKSRKLKAETNWQQTIEKLGGAAKTEMQFTGNSGVIATGTGNAMSDAEKIQTLPEHIRNLDAWGDAWNNSWADMGPKSIKQCFD